MSLQYGDELGPLAAEIVSFKLESFINRCKRLGCCSYNQPSYSQLISEADESFFKRIITYDGHVLQSLT